jgi:hypothetical protein
MSAIGFEPTGRSAELLVERPFFAGWLRAPLHGLHVRQQSALTSKRGAPPPAIADPGPKRRPGVPADRLLRPPPLWAR